MSNSTIFDGIFAPRFRFVSNSMNDDWFFTLESLFVSNSTVFDEIFTPRFRFVCVFDDFSLECRFVSGFWVCFFVFWFF